MKYMEKEAKAKNFFISSRSLLTHINKKKLNLTEVLKKSPKDTIGFRRNYVPTTKRKGALTKQAAKIQTTYETKGKKVYQILESNTEFANSTQPNKAYKYFKRKDEVKDFAIKTLVRRSESPLLKVR